MQEIALSNGWIAFIDDADAPLVAGLKWNGREIFGTRYAYAWDNARRKFVRMHRLVMQAQRGQMVDHANHNGLDNRRENLRFCTQQQNQFNRRIDSRNKSGFKGVSATGRAGTPWRAQATLNGRTNTIGYFATAEEAHAAYMRFATQNHGEFVCAG